MIESVFITGGSGYIGAEVVRLAVAAGQRVFALCRSEKAAETVRKLGARPVMGDILGTGAWQQTAAECDGVIHSAQPQTYTAKRISQQLANRYRDERLRMDANLLGALQPGRVQRIVYIGGTSYYGDMGPELRDESARPNPRGWGPYAAAAFEAVATYTAKGLPIIEAYPGAVYGPGSWFGNALQAIAAGKRLVGVRGANKLNSPIHLLDCARAVLHLLAAGEPGKRYFLVDDRACTLGELAQEAAKTLGVPLRPLLVPQFLARIIVGPVITDSLLYEQRLSNARLKGSGFTFEFPTITEGVPDVVARWRAMQPAGQAHA